MLAVAAVVSAAGWGSSAGVGIGTAGPVDGAAAGKTAAENAQGGMLLWPLGERIAVGIDPLATGE